MDECNRSSGAIFETLERERERERNRDEKRDILIDCVKSSFNFFVFVKFCPN